MNEMEHVGEFFLRLCAMDAISLDYSCSQRNLSFTLRSCRNSLSFPVSVLRTALILYIGLVIGSVSSLIYL